MVRVHNGSGKTISAKVSTWGDGNTEYYEISPGNVENWSRSDPRGFDLVILMDGFEKKYRVDALEQISVQSDGSIKMYDLLNLEFVNKYPI